MNRECQKQVQVKSPTTVEALLRSLRDVFIEPMVPRPLTWISPTPGSTIMHDSREAARGGAFTRSSVNMTTLETSSEDAFQQAQKKQ